MPGYPEGEGAHGVKPTSDLCAALFEEGQYMPVSIVERYVGLATST